MDDHRKNSFSRWLEILQQESWQLELLISGFAIFLLAESYEPVNHLSYDIQLLASGSTWYGILYIPYQVLMGAWHVLIVNLILHVLLRGLWISTIGLRYISGEIEFEELQFVSWFDRFLKRRIGSFDLYIQQLEKLCSSVFGFTFLIIFILISLGLFVVVIFFSIWALEGAEQNQSKIWVILLSLFLTFYTVGGVVYFLDFITLGWLKKQNWLGRYYYPFYRFYSALTLSFIYRPIYYNLVDNKFGRKVVLFIIPYLALFSFFSSLTLETESYLPGNRINESINTYLYDDVWDQKFTSYSASIPSKYVNNGFLDVYLPYIARSDDQIIEFLCPDLVPAERGVYFFGFNDPGRFQMDAEKAIDCHAQRFRIYINDSLQPNLKFRFYDHPMRQNVGLLTVIDVDYLPRGEHEVNVAVLLEVADQKDSLAFLETIRIPFWKE